MVRFIHAADLHLDSPFKGLKNIPGNLLEQIKESTFQALKNIVDQAIQHDVDFVLLAGDIYDIEDRSIKAQVSLKNELLRLKETDIPVYLIHGNHDYQADKQAHLELPSNVSIFNEEVETEILEVKSGETVSISGFSYNKRWIDERKIQAYPKRNKQTDYHIGLLHGFAEGQHTEHARYAPFSLSELREKGYDYWALGHIHKRAQLSENPLVYYSGNPQGRHKNESGEKGCLLVDMSRASSKVRFLPTASIVWENRLLDLTAATSLNALFEAIKEALMKEEGRNTLLNLTLHVSHDLAPSIMKTLAQADFYESLHVFMADYFIYIVDADVRVEKGEQETYSLESIFPSAWSQAIEELASETSYNEETDELYNSFAHAQYLVERNAGYRGEIMEKAINLLLQDLGVEEE